LADPPIIIVIYTHAVITVLEHAVLAASGAAALRPALR